MSNTTPRIHLLHTTGTPIEQQLQWEEAILRADDRNWCIINEGTPPAIVLGISGKVEQHVDAGNSAIPLIRRFSGGGTVVVDENTLFVTFIMNEADVGVNGTPGSVMEWTADFHRPLFDPHPFLLRENDFVIGERKCGGNAQYLCRGRWLQHTSFLWDYDPVLMSLLKHPPKMPEYRLNRPHEEFVCRVGEFLSKSEFIADLKIRLRSQFEVVEQHDHLEILSRPHRKSTKRV